MHRLPRLSKFFIFAVLLILSFSSQNCEKSNPIIPDDDDIIDLSVTPREDREAEEAALWLSHELIAPEVLYQTVKNDLAAIRASYMDRIPQLEITFKLNWRVSYIYMRITEEGLGKIRSGIFTEFDSLNTYLRVTVMDTTRLSGYPLIKLTFEGRLNPWRLVEFYEPLEEVVWVSPSGYASVIIPSLVYPWLIDEGMSYLFMKTYAGCEENGFWYFRVANHNIEYVGSISCSDSLPDWWEEAKSGYVEYWNRPYE